MCDPVSMGVAMGASMGVQIFGQQQQAKAQQAAANYNAKIAENNAVTAEENVRREQMAGAKNEQIQRLKMKQMMGQQKAALGASGFDVNTGGSVDLLASTATMGYEDLLSIRENSLAKQQQFHQQAADFTSQANLMRAQGSNARRAANLQAVSTVLDTATQYASMGMSGGWFDGAGGAGGAGGAKGSAWVDPDTGVIK